MKNKLIILGLVTLLTIFIPISHSAKAKASQNQEKITLTKITKRDMGHHCGKWTVEITNLSSQHPLIVKTGNHKITSQRSASTIKVFIMLTVLHQVKQHQLKLAKGIRHDLSRMIEVSDNQAANRLIRKAGGFKKITRTARRYGFKHTILRRFMLGSLKNGDNKTSVSDLTNFLIKIDRHQLLGKHYDKQMLELLHHCRNHSKLPKDIRHAIIYNKTGEYPLKGVQNDAALIKTKRGIYTIVAMAQGGQQAFQYRSMNRLGHDVVKYLDHH